MSSAPDTKHSFTPAPPEAWAPLVKAARIAGRPLERFLRIEAASGIVLLVVAAIALGWANSPWSAGYHRLWHVPVGLRVGTVEFERSLEWIVNDGLMAIFFFVVGLEIRRELHQGELSEWRRAMLPAAAALGGMVVPAAIYLAVAGGPATRSGWGVPMATDIAFAVGILTLLGKRVPPALRVLLLALAVIDDLGAIVVIALFYSARIAATGFGIAGLGVLGIVALQRLGVRAKLAYVVPGVVTWAGVYAAGVHPTIAGVVIGLITPVRAWFGAEGFVEEVRTEIDHLAASPHLSRSSHELAGVLRNVDTARREAMSPVESLIETLHPWVAFGIMPIFALANAGVSLSGASLGGAAGAITAGAALGLVAGKPLGVLLAVGAARKVGLGVLPVGITGRHVLVLGVVAGVGFTMSLFIAQLAFASPDDLAAAKVGVLAASGLAATVSLLLGRLLLRADPTSGAAECADDAERSTEH